MVFSLNMTLGLLSTSLLRVISSGQQDVLCHYHLTCIGRTLLASLEDDAVFNVTNIHVILHFAPLPLLT